jgi:hypothetical protein
MLEAICLWGEVEALLATILIAVVRRDARRTVEQFLELSSSRRQREVLEQAASEKLSPEQMELLSAALSVYSHQAKERNRLVHWCAGMSPEVPDAIILQDPKRQAHLNLALVEHIEGLRANGSEAMPDSFANPASRATMLVYRTSDFERTIREMEEVKSMLITLRHAIDPYGANSRPSQRLESMPRFQAALRRLRGDR